MIINFQNLLLKIKKPFQQGLSGIAITNAIIVSLLFTVFPVFGITTILITFVAIKFKLNLPIMVLISYIASPLQFLFFLPFIHIGEAIMNTKHTLLTVQEIKNAFDISFFNTIKQLLFELICGVSGWILLALPISLMVLFFSNKINNLIQNQNATH
ncbi:DUF2062 domain-containing protein [Flavobacterium chilense]|uniref:DUF2062 domain-containing protein n=1 Tax=Flavobacterium chilense TaxID=946677 RepID=A0A1M7ME76_9FLAO|nr:DUF2062 domain-containing protein [Flavobacterium chilense]SHM89117.1 hypothetical protein SAMN05444484_11253 [Flavobacterium chilense]